MLDYLNALACGLLLLLTIPIAKSMPSHSYALPRTGFVVFVTLQALQFVAPWVDFVGPPTVLQTGLSCLLLGVAYFGRRRIMSAYLESLASHPEPFADTQPAEYSASVAPASRMSTQQLNQARGGRGVET
jgi:hypothetical protein